MLKSPYKIKHWSPVQKVPKSVDPYWNVVEWEKIYADEYAKDIYEQLMAAYEQFMIRLKKVDDADKNYILNMLSTHPFLAYNSSTDEFTMLQYDDPVVAEKNDGTPIYSSEMDTVRKYT